MRLVFAGTPEFARIAFDALRAAGHDIPLVLTQPDRPAGRGLKLTPSPVKQAALDAGIAVAQPRSLRLDGRYPDEAAEAQARAHRARCDGGGRLRPDPAAMGAGPAAPGLPEHPCQPPAALARAAPIQRAIEAGDAQTGVTIMQMDAGLDTGDMLLERVVPIGAKTNAAQLHDALAEAGGEAIVAALRALAADGLPARKQPEAGVTYAAKLDKAEAALDCAQPASLLARRVRAFNPVPGANIRLPGLDDPVKIWRAEAVPAPAGAVPGVLRADADGIDIATGEGALRLLELQKAGGKRQPVDVFVRGWQPA